MKIRQGFVSNSSSSSFLIYGTVVKDCEDSEINDKLVSDLGLEVFDSPYGDNYIGISWDNIGGDETGNQFRKRIEEGVAKVLGKEAKCGTYSEAWYDG